MPMRPSVFNPRGQRSTLEAKREYDSMRRSARKRGYDTRWDRASKNFRALHPLCIGCLAVDRVTPATLVDHIKPHKGDRALMWDQGNWQAACAPHHDAVKQRLEALFDQGRATVADLRLDSAKAIALTCELMGVGGPKS